jgi:zinc protease
MTTLHSRLSLAGCAIALFFTADALAAVAPSPMKIQQHQLKNGLKIVLAEDQSRPVANLQIWYHVGSKDERPGRTGFAHLFEHIMFRGSKNVGPEEHMRIVRESGGELNAYTSFDMTVYWETFPSHYLERMLWLEADRMASLEVTQENFTKEREVVKEERRVNYENPPYGLLIEDVLRNTYSSYPYKSPPIGSMDDINAATIDDVREFHSTFYVPNNATLVLVGDFDSKNALALIEKHFAAIPRGKPVPRVKTTEPARKAAAEATVRYPNAPLAAVITSYLLPPMGHPDSYALEIASSILSSGQSSRLYKRLVYDERAAVAAFGQGQFLEGPSFFFGAAIANQGKNIKEVATSLEYTYGEMQKAPVTDEEMDKARNQFIARFILGRESVQAKADFLGRCAVLLGDPERYNTELAKYQAVTAADVQRVMKQYLDPARQVKIWVEPGAAPAATPPPAQ